MLCARRSTSSSEVKKSRAVSKAVDGEDRPPQPAAIIPQPQHRDRRQQHHGGKPPSRCTDTHRGNSTSLGVRWPIVRLSERRLLNTSMITSAASAHAPLFNRE
jgi:hypothetical protein